MNLPELVLIALGLSMDAFAAAVCRGLSLRGAALKNAVVVGLYFGMFQAGMPLIGYALGVRFQSKIMFIDHWIAFGLLGIIGINMIRESRKSACEITVTSKERGNSDNLLKGEGREALPGFRSLVVLATATSIDALAIGVTFAFLQVNIGQAVALIGIITFILSGLGVRIGNAFGILFKSKAEFAGGIILILIGTKILLEHTGILP